MTRTRLIALMLGVAVASTASADVVVERWGSDGRVQHKGVRYQDAGQTKQMSVELAPLKKGAKVHRSRLVFLTGEGYEVTAKDPRGRDVKLKLVAPYDLWFDATDAVAAAVADSGAGILPARQAGSLPHVAARQAGSLPHVAPTLHLTLHAFAGFKPEKTFLEIAYEGKCNTRPQQVTDLKAVYHHGQVFLTWKEIWDIAGGNPEARWGEMVDKVHDCTPLGIEPVEKDREIRYRVYCHTEPITSRNFGEARLLYSVKPGSVYVEERVPWAVHGEHGPTYLKKGEILKRVTLEADKPLPPGTGFHWHTVEKTGRAYYAVVTAIDGVENTVQIASQNSIGPIDVRVETPMPMLYRDEVTELRHPERAEHDEQWYNWWVAPPLSPYPKRYDVVVSYCPQTMLEPAPLIVTRGHAWITTPEPPRAGPHEGVYLAPSPNNPCPFWMGIPNSYYNLRSREQARWRPDTQQRSELLIRWVQSKFPIDNKRIVGEIGCWGMMEIERADLYAYLHGWGQPEMTKGFQAWGRAQIWGAPHIYLGRPDEENPWYRQDYGRWILEDPRRETPFFSIHLGWGAHFTEMGWPPFPRFLRAMIDTKRPFIYRWQVRQRGAGILPARQAGSLPHYQPVIRKNQSVPAFGNCSLDDNIGNGDLNNGYSLGAGQLNGYLNWDSETIVDQPDRWEMTVMLDDSAPLPTCTVDLTPRRCRQFLAKAGQRFHWTSIIEDGGAKAGSGTTVADQWGLVTIKRLPMVKGDQRVVIVRQ